MYWNNVQQGFNNSIMERLRKCVNVTSEFCPRGGKWRKRGYCSTISLPTIVQKQNSMAIQQLFMMPVFRCDLKPKKILETIFDTLWERLLPVFNYYSMSSSGINSLTFQITIFFIFYWRTVNCHGVAAMTEIFQLPPYSSFRQLAQTSIVCNANARRLPSYNFYWKY